MNDRNRSPLRNLILITEVGLAVIAPTVLGIFAGKAIDERFSTKFWLPILLALGLVAGLTGAWRLLKHFSPKKSDDEKPESYDLMEEWKKGDDGKPNGDDGNSNGDGGKP